jgi:hypothetical protein
MNQGDKVLLSSGGMDSFLLAHEPELRGAVHVFGNVGQKYLKKEMHAAHIVAEIANAKLVVVHGTNLAKYEHPSGIIPFRNAHLLLTAAQYGTELYMGVIADEINSDKSVEFIEAMEYVLNISHRAQYWTEGRQFRINTPYRAYNKTELIKAFVARGGSMGDLMRSVSCYSATEHHCGECASCFKRWVAITNATGKDQQRHFDKHPALWKPMAHWKRALESYSPSRAEEILSAFRLCEVPRV